MKQITESQLVKKTLVLCMLVLFTGYLGYLSLELGSQLSSYATMATVV